MHDVATRPGPPPLRPVQQPPPPHDPLPRIEALTRNARTTWFALLGVLVFVGVTLLGVSHIDFWGGSRETQLPLVNVSVPTRLFFAAAPILTAAIYSYFHVYLIRLWEALGEAPPQVKGQPLGNDVAPWLVSDAALYIRKISRPETPPCLPNRALDLPAAFLNFLLAWVFGLVVLWLAWRWSFPARDLWLSTAAGLSLAAAAIAGFNSLLVMLGRMSTLGPTGPIYRLGLSALMVAGLFSFAGIESWEKTSGPIGKLAPVLLVDAEIVTRPDGWTDRAYAMRDFQSTWCRREGIDPCTDLGDRQDDFDREWAARREAALIALVKPSVNPVKVVIVDEAVEAARLVEAENRNVVILEFGDTKIISEPLPTEALDAIDTGTLAPFRARAPNLQSADLRGAFLSGLDLSTARLSKARLNEARLEGARLTGADLRGAILTQAYLDAADLREARMEGADLRGAWMEGALLSGARLEGTLLSGAQLQRALLSHSLLTGTAETSSVLHSTNLSAGTNDGGALRFVDLRPAVFDRRTDWRNAFLDGSVEVTHEFRARAENPCQWTDEKLTDEAFYGRWRWWYELQPGLFAPWDWVAPEEWRDVPLDPGPAGCTWNTGEMNGPR